MKSWRRMVSLAIVGVVLGAVSVTIIYVLVINTIAHPKEASLVYSVAAVFAGAVYVLLREES